MNAFVCGLDIGAKLSSNLLIPQFPYINGLISAELYNFYTTLLYSSQSTKPALIPLDVFRNETPDTIQSVLGTASHMTSFTFNLTDRINLQNFNINDGSISSQEIYDTVNLGQLNGSGGKDTISLLAKENSLIPLLNEPKFTNTNIVKWAIDMIDIKVVGKSNFKITFYSMPDNRNGAVNDNFSIWSGTYQTVGKASNNSRLIQNTFILANNTFKFDQPFNYPQAIQPPPLIERAHPIFIDLSNQSQYGITNSIISTTPENNSYQMRPYVNEELSGYGRAILFSFKDYGYNSFDKFKEDYESMTFNFNFNMSGSFPLKGTSTAGNKKSWFTPIKINLTDLKDINKKNPQFESNNINYSNNSGNHNDATNNWTFNINNSINEGKNKQIATLTPNDSISNTYINDLLWTNDLPTTTGIDSLGSVWFKIVAYISFNKYIVLRYQFISTLTSWSYLGSTFVAKADWNLQTTSLVINPKSST
ncbi:hypothetical protein [Spiroplasma ixodetis]|uniref:hypothetical protein n=1 Tax=Spiroplasma ixodetis TaxID=2141 RepID=UPI002577D7D9|nr:hypothetical protein [Spiroplasma ixodetis]WJG70204.1 hypothetical protein SIXOD_v1c12780 [Spiroplasma ixodetis Y32]